MKVNAPSISVRTTETRTSSTILGADGRPAVYAVARDSAYEGASRKGSMAQWRPPRASADANILWEKDDLDDRSRDLIRNEPIAKSSINTALDLVVGTGPICRPMPDYHALGMDRKQAQQWAREVSNKFHYDFFDTTDIDAARQLNGTGLTRLWYRERLSTGEAAMLPLYLPDRVGVQYGLAFQQIDTDRISNRDSTQDTQYLRKGVEIDEYGAPIAYHVRKVHENDVAFFGTTADAWTWDVIPARNDWGRPQFMHSFDKTRPDQHRGIGLFSEILPLFGDLHKYKGAELKAALANAVVAGVMQSSVDMETLLEMYGGDAKMMLEERNGWLGNLGEGGAFIPLFPGDTFQSHNPSRPNTAFAAFIMSLMRQIAANTGLPYEIIMKDFTVGSYSSLKAVFNTTYLTIDPIRDIVSTDWLIPLYQMWLEEAVATGQVEAPGFWKNKRAWSRCRYLFPGRGWLDEVREAQAAQLRIATVMSTLEIECARQGLDYEEVIEQRAIEQDLMREHGVDMASVMSTIAIAPQNSEEEEGKSNQAVANSPAAQARRMMFTFD